MTLCEYFNSQFSIMQNLDFLVRILAACFCGACIGFERTKRFKEAGIRTHIIVCCAAALIMIVSKYGFADLTYADGSVFNGTRGADPARIAAQVVSGISFLGAGVIFKNGSTVKGLTTAAGIWATAGIGPRPRRGDVLHRHSGDGAGGGVPDNDAPLHGRRGFVHDKPLPLHR